MRFGIIAMQLDRLIPSGVSPQEAIAHVAGFDHAALVRHLASSGFTLIELGGDLGLFFPQSFALRSVEQLAALKQELGLSYTVHLPLWSVEPSTPLTPVRQGSARAVIASICATRLLQPEVYVFHSTTNDFALVFTLTDVCCAGLWLDFLIPVHAPPHVW